MINVPTVLILGAGSSAHCGYPLGVTLISRLCSLDDHWIQHNAPNIWEIDDIKAFLKKLSYSGHYSIDTFLESNPSMADMGKFLITQELKKQEHIDNLFPATKSGWYQYLFNRLLPEKGNNNFADNKLSIITFNYDRSIEAYLHTALQARLNIDERDATEFLKQLNIIHVHGILGDYPTIPYTNMETNTEMLIAISQKIQIIYEIADQEDRFCNSMFEQAHEALLNAERIYFLGFGFHPDNIRRLRFFTPDNTANRMIRGTITGLGVREREALYARLAPLGVASNCLPPNGTHCHDFFSHEGSLD